MSPALWRVAVDLPDASLLVSVAAAIEEQCAAISAFEVDGGKGFSVEGLSRDKPNVALIEATLALIAPGQARRVSVIEQVPRSAVGSMEELRRGFPPAARRPFFHHVHWLAITAAPLPRAASIPILIERRHRLRHR